MGREMDPDGDLEARPNLKSWKRRTGEKDKAVVRLWSPGGLGRKQREVGQQRTKGAWRGGGLGDLWRESEVQSSSYEVNKSQGWK